MKINNYKKQLPFICFLIVLFFGFGYYSNSNLLNIYEKNASKIIKDRHDNIIAVLPNEKGYYALYLEEVPKHLEEVLILKEDRYFRWHFGINPWSTINALTYRLGLGKRKASSTITQQLVKILLEQELERTLNNKLKEAYYTFFLELFQNKDKILEMYVNSIYLGNQSQGIKEASNFYFNVDPKFLTNAQVVQLLSTINSPTPNNPAQESNKEYSFLLEKHLNVDLKIEDFHSKEIVEKNIKSYVRISSSFFELKEAIELENDCNLTIDKNLTEEIRKIIKRNIDELSDKNVSHAAAIVLSYPENEIIALIGSPNPYSETEGSQINMLKVPRSIGSTIKPFIYLKGLENNLRPYTLINDREYKYITVIGLPLYPKNFDYQYRGLVSLDYSLSNSLNVPTVKILEYLGLEEFYNFLEQDLSIKPVQEIEKYQLGIALGNFEMSLYELARIFTIFSNKGEIKDLKISNCQTINKSEKITEEKYIQLINKILNDRKGSIDQFGFHSKLNLFQENYALKTGTSRDFRDSWIVGYTPDFLVGVWLGNADLSPTDEISGQRGAGKIWSEIMQSLFYSEYNKKTSFDFSFVETFKEKDGKIVYGLEKDDIEYHRNILIKEDQSLILSPYDNDVFLIKPEMEIPLKANQKVDWYVNGKILAKNQEKTSFFPVKPEVYHIEAMTSELKESIFIKILEY